MKKKKEYSEGGEAVHLKLEAYFLKKIDAFSSKRSEGIRHYLRLGFEYEELLKKNKLKLIASYE